jgi:hypothetical protein
LADSADFGDLLKPRTLIRLLVTSIPH